MARVVYVGPYEAVQLVNGTECRRDVPVELDDALAASLLHDSPGVLTLVDGEAVVDESTAAPEPAPEAEADDVADEGATAPETDEAKPTRGGKR